MGEEGAIGGTIRFVDSSLERLQVKAINLEGERFAVTCNGRAMPLQPTGERGRTSPGSASAPGNHRPACTRPSACIRRYASI